MDMDKVVEKIEDILLNSDSETVFSYDLDPEILAAVGIRRHRKELIEKYHIGIGIGRHFFAEDEFEGEVEGTDIIFNRHEKYESDKG
tara:strand:- start:5980 stop:6240 length:261 start_codon:yes stop_codon:yes gene_type:complete